MAPEPQLIIRDSTLGRALYTAIGAWAVAFALVCTFIGDIVTSKQWTYLMGVPGGKWFWSVLFGVAAFVVLAGVVWNSTLAIALGLFVIGSGCGLITAFYLLAPLIDPGLLTLGYMPWALCAAIAYPCAVTAWKPLTWF